MPWSEPSAWTWAWKWVLAAFLAWPLVPWLRELRRMAAVAANIPGPRLLPIFGNFFDVPFKDIRKVFGEWLQEHGRLVRMWFGPLLMVLVVDPDDVEAVLTNPACASKPYAGYAMAAPFIGNGLLVINGPTHRRHRKAILPTLHRDILDQFHPLMRKVALELVDALRPKAASGEVFDAVPICGLTSINTTFRTLLSADDALYEKLLPMRVHVAHKTNRGSYLLMYRALRPWFWPDLLFRLSGVYNEYMSMTKLYDELILAVIAHKGVADLADAAARKAAEAKHSTAAEVEAAAPRRRRAFMDHLMASEEARAALPGAEMYNEIKTMVAGGFVTSMEGLSAQLLLLSKLPDVQTKIQAELDEVFGDSDRDLELDDLEHLPYLERFIKEGLRFLPPFAVIAREAQADVPVPSGYTIPRGSMVLLSPLVTQRLPEYYPEPERFDPDRFLPEVKRPTCAFMPFALGPRNCVGARYALMFLKINLATVMRRYTLLPDPDGPSDLNKIRMRLGITYFPRDGCRIRVRERER